MLLKDLVKNINKQQYYLLNQMIYVDKEEYFTEISLMQKI